MSAHTARYAFPSAAPTRELIVDGPTKDELKAALFDTVNGQHITVTFDVRPEPSRTEEATGGASDISEPTRVEALIREIGREDESDHNWLFEGWICGVSIPEPSGIRGYYDTDDHSGWFQRSGKA